MRHLNRIACTPRSATWMGALALVTVLAAPALADGFIIIERPSPEVRLTPLWVKNHDVKVTIEGQVAMTSVDQVFYNPNNMQLEGTYIFPIPEDAGIESLSLWIDGVEQKAELLDRDKARSIYEGIVRRMKDPALLEYVGRKAFKLRVFPIPARGERRVKLAYREVLPAEGGFTEYLYPLNTEKFSSQPLERVLVDIEISSPKPLGNVVVLSHKAEINRPDDHHARITYEARKVTPDRDFFLHYGSTTKDIGLDVVSHRSSGDDGYALVALSPRVEIDKASIQAKDVVFVFDNSGSMHGARFKQATAALSYCVDTLRDGDRFEIINFATEAHSLFEKLVEVGADSRKRAQERIDKLEPLGGTNVDEAMSLAQGLNPKADRPFMIVFLTDGQPTIGETTNIDEILQRVSKRGAENQRIFAFGVGNDVNTDLLDRLAGENHGSRDYVAETEDIEVKVGNLWTKIASPVLSEVSLLASGGATLKETFPRKLPDLFAGVQLLVLTRFDGSGPTAIRLKGKVGGEAKEYVFECRFPETEKSADYLPRLWAVRKVGYLLDEIHIHGENKELVDEVVRLSKKHGIMTPYTSYLVIEDERATASNERRESDRVMRTIERQRGFARGGDDDGAGEAGEGGGGALRRAFQSDGREQERLAGRSNGSGSWPATPGAAAPSDMPMAEEELDELRRTYELAGGDKAGKSLAMDSGELAVRASRFIERLKDASEVKDIASSLAGEVGGRIQHAAGKTFYLQGQGWVQAEVYDAGANVEIMNVKAFSDEYFALLTTHADLARILALGDTVCFLAKGRIYVITP